jgi:SAM-dependent methyltransferase
MTPATRHAPVSDSSAATRARRDQALFEQVALEYCRKDLTPSARRGRSSRLRQSFAALPPLDRPRLLEAGCGGGFSATYLRGRFAQYLGIDYSENLIAFARQENGGADIHFEVADIMSYQPAEPADVVFMIGVLHHLPEPDRAVAHMRDWLRPGGWFLANEPQSGNPLVQLARRYRKRVDHTYSDEQEELSRQEFARLLTQAGLQNVKVIPQGLLSTPFAETVAPVQPLARRAAALACRADAVVERFMRPLLYRLAWNLIAVGQRPHSPL